MQIFHRSANVISRTSIYVGIFTLAFALWACVNFQRSPYVTYAGIARPQPAPFSHEHHVAALGIDCRYCHTSVETSGFAGIPPTKTCMNCHSQIWTAAPMLEPVRESYRTGKSLVWNRVNDLPDFVYFDHSIHINKGVGCNTCHGAVDRMPLMFNYASLQMEWCIECHRGRRKICGRVSRSLICGSSRRRPCRLRLMERALSTRWRWGSICRISTTCAARWILRVARRAIGEAVVSGELRVVSS